MKDVFVVVHCVGTAAQIPQIMKHQDLRRDFFGDPLFGGRAKGTPTNERMINNERSH